MVLVTDDLEILETVVGDRVRATQDLQLRQRHRVARQLQIRLLEMVVRQDMGDSTTLLLHPTGVAAWFGVLITLLNLLPLAQLDGGHIAYALFGRFHAFASWPLVVLLVAMGFIWHGWWLWAVITIVMGPRHPRIWDETHPLDRKRKIVAWICILIFVLCFMPAPIEIFD